MQRYFIDPIQWHEHYIELIGDDAHHAARVMRMQVGDSFIVTDGKSRCARVCITEVSGERVVADLEEQLKFDKEPNWRVTIAQSLPKGDKFELVLQKATEIGAYAFVPFTSSRTIVEYDAKKADKQAQRWRKIVKEAAEQAHRCLLPEVRTIASWKRLLETFVHYDQVIFCYEKTELSRGLRDAIRMVQHKNELEILVVVGPEGGFTPQEAEQAAEAGAAITTLGSRILRTETAALVALSAMMYESGEMGGN